MDITYMHLIRRINNPQTPIKPVGIILHYIGNPGTSARANARYFAGTTEKKSVHYIVDDYDVVEIIPPTYKSYGTSDKRYNESYIQIEMCHKDATGKISAKTLENVVWLCRKLIKEYKLAKVIRHFDVTGKYCPLWYVNHPHEWEQLVKRIMKGEDEPMSVDKALGVLVQKGVINSPDYWATACKYVKNLDAFIIKVATYIDGKA